MKVWASDQDTLILSTFCRDSSCRNVPPGCAEVYLHVLVFDLFTRGDAVGDVEVDELWGEVYSRGQSNGGEQQNIIPEDGRLILKHQK